MKVLTMMILGDLRGTTRLTIRTAATSHALPTNLRSTHPPIHTLSWVVLAQNITLDTCELHVAPFG